MKTFSVEGPLLSGLMISQGKVSQNTFAVKPSCLDGNIRKVHPFYRTKTTEYPVILHLCMTDPFHQRLGWNYREQPEKYLEIMLLFRLHIPKGERIRIAKSNHKCD